MKKKHLIMFRGDARANPVDVSYNPLGSLMVDDGIKAQNAGRSEHPSSQYMKAIFYMLSHEVSK